MLLRLKFVVLFLLVTACLGAGPSTAQSSGGMPERGGMRLPLSPVVLAERPGAVQEFTVDSQQVRQMLDRALLTLTSASDIGTAWKRLGITPQDVVGIKITTAGGPAFSTHSALVRAICDGLQAAGVPRIQMIIWDKFQDKMGPAGYVLRAATDQSAAIESIVPANNYDPAVYYRNGLMGSLIYGDSMFNQSLGDDSGFTGDASSFDERRVLTRSYYTTFVTRICTKLINVPVLSDNERFGIDGCLSSLALGSVDNNRRFLGPPSYGDPAIDEIFNRSFIRRKVVVHILDALVAQCAGGPDFTPQFCASLGALYVGRDPVAIDSLALPRLEALRRQMEVTSVGNTSSYITSAAVLGLGTTDRRRIQLVRVP